MIILGLMDDLTKGLALDDRAEPTRANADGGLARPLPRGVEEAERDSLDTTVAAFPGTKPSADSELRLRLVDVDINDNQTTQNQLSSAKCHYGTTKTRSNA